MTSRWIYKELLLCAWVLFSFHGPHVQADEWSEGDKWRQGIYTALHVIDWDQTHDIQERGRQDRNVIMGPTPSSGEIDKYFAATLVAHYLIADALPTKWRKRFQCVTIGVEAAAVGHNFSVGYRLKF